MQNGSLVAGPSSHVAAASYVCMAEDGWGAVTSQPVQLIPGELYVYTYIYIY